MSRIFALSTLMFALTTAAPLTASAGSKCKTFNPDKLIKAATKVCGTIDGTKRFDCSSDKVNNAGGEIKEWLNVWNSIADNGGGTIGPRIITWVAPEFGRIIAPGDRTWVSEEPAVGGASVAIRYNEGKATVDISYCSVDAEGTIRTLDTDRVKGGSPPRKHFAAKDIDGKFLYVQLDGRKPWARAYDYEIRIRNDGKSLPAPAEDPRTRSPQMNRLQRVR